MACDLCGLGEKPISTDVGTAGNWSTAEQVVELLPVAEVNKRVMVAMREFRRGLYEPYMILMGWEFWVQAKHAHECASRMMSGGSPEQFELFGVVVLLDPHMAKGDLRVLAKPDHEIMKKVADLHEDEEATMSIGAAIKHAREQAERARSAGSPACAAENEQLAMWLQEREQFESAAASLWHLLDNIDTLDDACKDSDLDFRNAVRKQQQARGGIANSYDGHTLVWAWEPQPSNESEPDEATDG